MSQPRSAPPELPGFELVRGIGGGGFADVFLYNQLRPFRPVAVKVLRAEHLSEASLAQFAVEADVMAQVSAHPNIVTIHTSGVAPDGRPYIVMEHYPGPHFGLRARGGRLSLSEVLRVGVQVASAVETAHRAHILHRDIKPANILTSEYGRPGLTDFGISGVRTGTELKAAAGVTLAYSSPEVLLDETDGGAEASDVYSLCATLYSLIAGHSPSWVVGGDNSDAAMLNRVVQGITPPLTRDDVPGSLNHLLTNGLSIDPGHRPRSALDLARSLQSIEQELSLSPTPLEVRDDLATPTTTRRPRVEADPHGTRRRPRVIDPEGPGARVPRAPAPIPETVAGDAPVLTPVPVAASIAPMPRVGERDRSAVALDDTVLRPGSPTPEPAPVRQERRRSRVRVPMPVLAAVAAGIAATVAVVGIAVLIANRPDEPPALPATTTVAVPDELIVTSVVAPADVAVTREPTGDVVVTFTPPPAVGADAPRFQVFRLGSSWPGGSRYELHPASPVRFSGIAPTEQVCVQVATVTASGAASEPSAPVCATSS